MGTLQRTPELAASRTAPECLLRRPDQAQICVPSYNVPEVWGRDVSEDTAQSTVLRAGHSGPRPFPGGPSLPAPPTGTRGSYNFALMKLPSTLQSPHQLSPLLPILPTPVPVLLYNLGEKGG